MSSVSTDFCLLHKKIAKLVYKYLDIISHAKNKIDHGLKPEIIKTYSENNKEMPK